MITRDKIEDPNAHVIWDSEPTDCHCPHCNEDVTTFITYKASIATYVAAFTVWVIFGWASIFCLPLIFPAFKEDVHHCPTCLNILHKKSRIRLPEFRADVMTLKLGNCAMVLSMKYVIIFVLIFVVIIIFQFLRGVNLFDLDDAGPFIPKTWNNFLDDCTPRGYHNPSLGGVARLSQKFDQMYRFKNIKWEAEVVAVREGVNFFAWKTDSMLVCRGIPPQYITMNPDMILMFSHDLEERVSEVIPPIFIRFNATMVGLGRRGTAHLLKLWDFEVIEKPSAADDPSIVIVGESENSEEINNLLTAVKEALNKPESKDKSSEEDLDQKSSGGD